VVSIRELLKRPLQDEKWLEKTVIGGVLMWTPFSWGYIVGLFRNVIKKEEDILPEWRNWGKLFSDGIIMFVVKLVYVLIPALIFVIGAAVGTGCVLSLACGAFMIFISAVAWLGVSFILPMAICHYVATDDIKSAFAWKVVFEKIKSTIKDYGLAYLIMIGLVMAAYIVLYLVVLIIFFSIVVPPLFVLLLIFGWIVLGFVFFYLGLVLARMFGEIYPVESVEEKKAA
jgi:hypothetical protein